MNETSSTTRHGPTMVSRIAFAMVLFLGLATIASGVGGAVVAGDEAVNDRAEPVALAVQPPGDVISQVNDTTPSGEETLTNGTDDGVTETNETETAETSQNGTTEGTETTDLPVGARLAGVIGAQQVEHRTAVESRAFEKAFDNAHTNGAKAAVVSNQTARIEERVRDLERERDRLEDRYESGQLPDSAYRAQMMTLEARLESLAYRANRTVVRSASVPTAALERRGLPPDRLRSLENRTARASGSGAPSVTPGNGPPMGTPVGVSLPDPGNGSAGPPANTGPPADSASNSSVPDSGPSNRSGGPGAAKVGNGSSGPTDRGPTGIDRPRNTTENGYGNGNGNGNATANRNGNATENASFGPSVGNDDGPWFADFVAVKFVLGFVR